MTIEHGIIRLLLVISLLIVVPGAWMSGRSDHHQPVAWQRCMATYS